MTNRREFCSNTAAAVCGCLLLGSAKGQSDATTVSGTVQSAAGASVGDSRVVLVNHDTREWYRAGLGDSGEFTKSIPTGATYDLMYFDGEVGDLISPDFDGVPAVADLDAVAVDTETDALGDYTVPEGYLIHIRIEDPEGNPLQNVPLSFYPSSGNGTGPSAYTTNENGYVTHVKSDRPGIELSASVTVRTHPPGGGGETLLTVFADEQKEKTAILRNPDEYNNVIVREDTDGSTTPATVESTDSSTPEETAESTDSSTPTTQQIAGTDQSAQSGDGQQQRGFLSNSADEPAVLSDPMTLTVGGFILSVVGIINQMLGGK